jgi:gas vesicle protein
MGKTTNVIVAAAAGFIAGVLMAPKSGEETRRDLKNKAYDMKDRAGQKAERLKDAARDAGDSLHRGMDNVTDEAKEMAKSARSSAQVVARETAANRRSQRPRVTRCR